jgi:hypothetical protein
MASWIQRPLKAAPSVPGSSSGDAQQRRDELDHHQREREHDERVDDQRKLRPLERLTETGHHQHPAGHDDGEVPDDKDRPAQRSTEHRAIRQPWHRKIQKRQKCVAEPAKEDSLRVVVTQAAPRAPGLAAQELGDVKLERHGDAEQHRHHEHQHGRRPVSTHERVFGAGKR